MNNGMKRFGILVFAMVLLISTAMAASICPFGGSEKPEEASYLPTVIGFQVAGTGIGFMNYNEQAVAEGMESGNCGTTSSTFSALGKGPLNYAFTTDLTLEDGPLSSTSQRVIGVGVNQNMLSTSMVLSEGNYLSSCGTFEDGCCCGGNVTDPYCESAYTSTSAVIKQGTYVSQASLANRPTGIMLMQQGAVTGDNGGLAIGSATMSAGYSTMSMNLTSSGTWSSRWDGAFQMASQYNYKSQRIPNII